MTVAANSDKETRKSWYENLDAIRLFLDNNPDVKDFMAVFHTNPVDPRGVNLQLAVKKRGLENIVKLENPFQSNTGILDEEIDHIGELKQYRILTLRPFMKGVKNR